MKRLGEILMEHGAIDLQQLDFCLKVQGNNKNSRLGELLTHYHFTDSEDIAHALSKQYTWPLFLGTYLPSLRVVKELGESFCISKSVFPLEEDGELRFVLLTGEDVQTSDFLRDRYGGNTCFYIGIEHQLKKALHQLAHEAECLIDPKEHMLEWFNKLFIDAIRLDASDIHIEPSAKALEVRLRINGILQFYNSLPILYHSKLVNVIFHKSELTVGDYHHFHDARFSHHMDHGRSVDVRVSHIPCLYGSSLVLRILEKDKVAYPLTKLGFSNEHWTIISNSLARPDGITLIVGPTGCGKTTTLYAMLNHLKDLSKKIVTIEDPIEMPLPLTTQLQIHEERGITFSDSVRAFLRHDPDLMLIGEIRDSETAHQAMRCAMTGHKVFSTLHTTKAVDSLFRMIDLGVEPFLLGQSLHTVISQRLVRTLCPLCKVSKMYERSKVLLFQQKYIQGSSENFYTAVGCKHCKLGFTSRTVIAEMLNIDEDIQKSLIMKDWQGLVGLIHSSDQFISFFKDAQRILRKGETSLEEISRVLG